GEAAGHSDVLNILVQAVSDAARRLVERENSLVPKVVERLLDRGWFVFRRIALWLLAEFPNMAPELVAAQLTDRALFNEIEVQHEYAVLLGRAFPNLTTEEQEKILGWIEDGPRTGDATGSHGAMIEGKIQDEEQDFNLLAWKRDRLSWIGASLPSAWAARYQELVAALGAPDHADYPYWQGGIIMGPNSPKTEAELREMSAVDVVRFLRQWRPPENEFMGPSQEGLGRVLSLVVAANPGPYALVARIFRGVDPTYVGALVSGLRDAVRGKRTFEWSNVLSLCQSVISSPWEIEPGNRYIMERDSSWSPTNHRIAELLSAALDGDALPSHLGTRALDVLIELSSDPEPTPEYEAEYGGDNMDPLTLSINTARGEAMHSIVRFLLWLRRTADREGTEEGATSVRPTADLAARAWEVLERHLDPSIDPSPAIRSVYGQWIPWLVLLDPEWARRNLDAIFPVDPSMSAYWAAAWHSYLFYSRLYDNVFDFLSQQYSQAVERMGSPVQGVRSPHDADSRLGEHLIVMYWRGKVNLDDPSGILSRFYDHASGQARYNTLEFVGRSLRGTNMIEDLVSDRLRRLWEYCAAAAEAAPIASDSRQELAAFGSWFASMKFESSWSVTQLLRILRAGVQVDPEHLVVESLAALAPSFPGEAIESLRLVAQGDEDGWRVYGWRREARSILATGMASADPRVEKASRDLIDWFESRGLHDFRDLLVQPK
ncbi:MAG: hypothetical protein ACYC1C_18100, partial [Chloroflexota bacterium]